MQEIVLQILKEDYQKALKKVIFFFFKPSPFEGAKLSKTKRVWN